MLGFKQGVLGLVGKQDVLGLVGKQDVLGLVGKQDVLGLVGKQDVLGLVGKQDVLGLVGKQDVLGLVGKQDVFCDTSMTSSLFSHGGGGPHHILSFQSRLEDGFYLARSPVLWRYPTPSVQGAVPLDGRVASSHASP